MNPKTRHFETTEGDASSKGVDDKGTRNAKEDDSTKEQSRLLTTGSEAEKVKEGDTNESSELGTEKAKEDHTEDDDGTKKCDYDLYAQIFNSFAMGGYVLQDLLYFTIDVSKYEFSIMMTSLGALCVINSIFCVLNWKSGRDETAPEPPLYRNVPFLAEFFNILGSVCLMMSGLFTFPDSTIPWAHDTATGFDQAALWVIMLDTLLQFATAKKNGEFTKPFSSINPILWGHILNVVPQMIYVAGWLLDLYQRNHSEILRDRHHVKHYEGPARVTRCCSMDGVVFLCYFVADVLYLVGAIFWLWGCFRPASVGEQADKKDKAR